MRLDPKRGWTLGPLSFFFPAFLSFKAFFGQALSGQRLPKGITYVILRISLQMVLIRNSLHYVRTRFQAALGS